MCIYIYIFFFSQILFHYSLLQGIGYSSLCCIVYLLFIYFVYNILLFMYLIHSGVYLLHSLLFAEVCGSSLPLTLIWWGRGWAQMDSDLQIHPEELVQASWLGCQPRGRGLWIPRQLHALVSSAPFSTLRSPKFCL